RVLRALDEIAGGVDHEQPRALALDLAAEQERDVESHVGCLERPPFHVVQSADGAADALRGLKHRRRVHQRLGLAGLGILQSLAQHADDRLADREVAGGGDRHDPRARLHEYVQLAEGRDVVDARIGTGIREHYEAVANEDAAAIGHDWRASRMCWNLYTGVGGGEAMLMRRCVPAQFCVCWVAWATRTRTES